MKPIEITLSAEDLPYHGPGNTNFIEKITRAKKNSKNLALVCCQLIVQQSRRVKTSPSVDKGSDCGGCWGGWLRGSGQRELFAGVTARSCLARDSGE